MGYNFDGGYTGLLSAILYQAYLDYINPLSSKYRRQEIIRFTYENPYNYDEGFLEHFREILQNPPKRRRLSECHNSHKNHSR